MARVPSAGRPADGTRARRRGAGLARRAPGPAGERRAALVDGGRRAGPGRRSGSAQRRRTPLRTAARSWRQLAPWDPEESKAAGGRRRTRPPRSSEARRLLELSGRAACSARRPGARPATSPEAHAGLVPSGLRALHAAAEAAREPDRAAAPRRSARAPTPTALPDRAHPARVRAVATWLQGDGSAHRCATDTARRRGAAAPVRGPQPAPGPGAGAHPRPNAAPRRPLPMGSYLCVLRHPECARRPLPGPHRARGALGRRAAGRARAPPVRAAAAPASSGPTTASCPPAGSRSGGDAAATDSLPRRRLVVRRRS